MADRTHEDEDALTRDVSKGVGSYQEGEEGRSPDEFISSEVNEKTAQPMHPSKTRS